MNYAVVGLLWGVLKYVIAQPIVKVALDNWTKGTSNKIDDLVWKMLKQAAGIPDEVEREAFVVRETAKLQGAYNEAKAEGTLAQMKADKRAWDMASLSLDGGNASDNIA